MKYSLDIVFMVATAFTMLHAFLLSQQLSFGEGSRKPFLSDSAGMVSRQSVTTHCALLPPHKPQRPTPHPCMGALACFKKKEVPHGAGCSPPCWNFCRCWCSRTFMCSTREKISGVSAASRLPYTAA